MMRWEMKNGNMILTEKLQKYPDYHREKIDKYEFVTDEEILPSEQSRIIEPAKFRYFSLGKDFEKEGLLKGFFQKRWELMKIQNEIELEKDEIKKWKEMIKRKDLKCEANKYKFDFQLFKTIKSFRNTIYNGKININILKNNLFENILNFNNKSRLK